VKIGHYSQQCAEMHGNIEGEPLIGPAQDNGRQDEMCR